MQFRIAVLVIATVVAGEARAAYRVVHSHQLEEAVSWSALIEDGSGNLYGTTRNGGYSNSGTVFRLKPDGSNFTVLHAFVGGSGDGSEPLSALVLDSSGSLFGTTTAGGSANMGTVFSIKTDGTGFALLHSFQGDPDGATPWASLAWDGAGTLFGTTTSGGAMNYGSVFSIGTDGKGYRVLHSFVLDYVDGLYPTAPLTLDGSGHLYGTAKEGGGPKYGGIVFKLKTDGTGFAVLHAFVGGAGDGFGPLGPISLDRLGRLVGTTWSGGSSNKGTLFRLSTDGNGFTVLHNFAGAPSDGAAPCSSVVADDSGNLFGTTRDGGAGNLGTIFRVRDDGSGFALLHSLASDTSEGSHPFAPPLLDASGTLFGTTYDAGAFSAGTVFRISADGSAFEVIRPFASGSSTGLNPGLLVTDHTGALFGITPYGGPSGRGTLFRLTTDGGGFELLHTFAFETSNGSFPVWIVLDGAGNIYGATSTGGAWQVGTVFTCRSDGSEFRILHSFAGGANDGGWPTSVVLDGSGHLFGTSTQGGSSGLGTVFRMNIDGSGFRLLHSFLGVAFADGSIPEASLVLDGSGNLFGTTVEGGATPYGGTVFTIKSDGTGYKLLYALQGSAAALALGRNELFGTAALGGLYGRGLVYKLNGDGTGFTWLHSFGGDPSDGISPYSSLVLDSRGNLFGTTSAGGASGLGTVFTLKTDGTGYALLHAFAGGPGDGASSNTPLVLDASGYLFGTTQNGGPWDEGVEFRLEAHPGDANGDGMVDVSDAFALIDALFASGPPVFAGADVNGDDTVDVRDAFYLINYLFDDGPAPRY